MDLDRDRSLLKARSDPLSGSGRGKRESGGSRGSGRASSGSGELLSDSGGASRASYLTYKRRSGSSEGESKGERSGEL